MCHFPPFYLFSLKSNYLFIDKLVKKEKCTKYVTCCLKKYLYIVRAFWKPEPPGQLKLNNELMHNMFCYMTGENPVS